MAGSGCFFPSSDTRYAETQEWFWHQWTSALRVRERDLRNADRKWNLRKRFFDELADTSDVDFEPMASKYVLKEGDLFKPAITGANQIRMASQSMETLFRPPEPKPDKTMIRIPAFVSSILWTFYGQAIPTAINGRPEFQLPAHVWSERWSRDSQNTTNQRYMAFFHS